MCMFVDAWTVSVSAPFIALPRSISRLEYELFHPFVIYEIYQNSYINFSNISIKRSDQKDHSAEIQRTEKQIEAI